jgi:uncharacterized protein (TIRG00374 family)
MAKEDSATSVDAGRKSPSLWGWHTYASLAVTAGVLVVMATLVDLEKIRQEVTSCNKAFVILGMLAHYATYPVRGLRWRRCLRHFPLTAGRAKFGLLVFFYNAVDNVVPAKLGDVYGSHLARINCGVSRSAALGSIVFLRMVDSWVVLLLALLSSWLLFAARLPRPLLWALIGGGIVAIGASTVMLAFILLKKSTPKWLPERVRRMIHSFYTGMWPRPGEMVSISFLTLTIWTMEMLWIYFLAMAFGLGVGFLQALFLTMIPLMASAFPFTPSGAGAVELTLFSCLRAIGVTGSLAASVTVVNRFIDYWLHIALGLVIWAVRRKIGLRTWREVPPDDFRDPLPQEGIFKE